MSERIITPNNHETNCRHSTKHIQLHYFTVVHHPGWNEIIAWQGLKTCHQSGWIMGIWTKKDLILCKTFPNIVYLDIHIYIHSFLVTYLVYMYNIYICWYPTLFGWVIFRNKELTCFFLVEKIGGAKNQIYLEKPKKRTPLKWMDGNGDFQPFPTWAMKKTLVGWVT